MPQEPASDLKFEIGHVLFIDIVGYSKLLIHEQSEQLQELKNIVRGTKQFQSAQAEGKLLLLPTGDGGALVFRNSPEEPVACALEISKSLKNHPDLRVRMGIHSGPVNEIADLNEQANIAGAGINIAQRVMDCGDAGHILLSKHVAEDLEHYSRWRPLLHDLGECEVKHGAKISIINLYTEELGNPEPPQKFKKAKQTETRPDRRAMPIARTAVGVGYKRTVAVALGAITVLAVLWYLVLRPGSAIRETAKPITNVNFTQLTDLPGPEYFPSLSPDGKSLIYVSRASGNWDIYLQRVGGRNPTNLTKDSTADDTQPAFSPDGERIVFRSEREGGGIYLMGATGESARRLSDFGYNPVWSPDGERVLVATESVIEPSTRPTKSQLWTINVSDGDRHLVTEGDALQPNWSPHRHRIAYWGRPQGGQGDVWTISADGHDSVRVTSEASMDWNPVWSPDGRYLYFCSDRTGNMNIWRVPIAEKTGKLLHKPEAVTSGAGASAEHISLAQDGRRIAYVAHEEIKNLRKVTFDPFTEKIAGEPVPITRGSLQCFFPDPSPDGDWLAYYSLGKQEDIFIIRADGTDMRELTGDAFKDREPRWSPDGKRIAFTSDRSGSSEIWAINRDGSGLQQLTQMAGAHHPVWSPDGTQMVYSIHTPKNAAYIFRVGQAWAEQPPVALAELSDTSQTFESWSWSPDGKRLAGLRHFADGSHAGIGVYDLESKKYDWLTNFGEWPLWFEDGRRILFADHGKIFVVDSESRKYHEVFPVADGDIGSPGLSRDNRLIYFTFVAAEADIWLLEWQ
jgi:Tol biopolymer transport system component/class 3 adenylate cyclase